MRLTCDKAKTRALICDKVETRVTWFLLADQLDVKQIELHNACLNVIDEGDTLLPHYVARGLLNTSNIRLHRSTLCQKACYM